MSASVEIREKLNTIINSLFSVPDEIRNTLPAILSKPHSVFQSLTDQYFLVVILNDSERKRIGKFMDRNLDPYPGLILSPGTIAPSAITLESTKNFFWESNTVKNMYSFDLGRDCTIILQNHYQSIRSNGVDIAYTIDLAFLISFGNEITHQNFYKYLEDLIAFSFKTWRSRNTPNQL